MAFAQTWPFIGQLLCVWFYCISVTCRLPFVKAESCYSCFFPISPPASFSSPRVEGSFCINEGEPVLILIWSVNPTAERFQNLVKTLLIHLLLLFVWFCFFIWGGCNSWLTQKVEEKFSMKTVINLIAFLLSDSGKEASLLPSPAPPINNTIFNCK